MRIRRLAALLSQKLQIRHMDKLPLSTLFLVGILVGILIVNLQEVQSVAAFGLFDRDALQRLDGQTFDQASFFCESMSERLGSALFILIASTTYLGLLVCGGIVVWYGILGGSLLALAVSEFGIKGLLFVAVGLLPQFFVFIPAYYLVIRWGEECYRHIYIRKRNKNEAGEKFLLPRKIGMLLGALMLLVVGCLLECYVNPDILSGFIKLF